ncbi:XRE family transcriptional regulator [Carbonactinospora thermoautotrophica]|uniref:XRE family transcriptional regulator n=1 Tax=Carbonactinospora thermoautotrophica TaxID=1469144 RepID=A0A132NDH9_9ACTN|nr:helix-turn-helix transcriptional regulator [Carbonactinospora thermoautotrophica]KWX05390.1 XRE family transcriptional regulator [Carbonactinospora thermoautotrophica]KWX08209.1 XRE family transcriptional regulator [Carbonactinospora thermoautotrophica]
MTTTRQRQRPVGELLRQWRERRRLSQLELAIQAGISTRHLSFVETGRSVPSRDMVLHLADQLDVPLRERNHLLLAAGYAPVYPETALDSPQMSAVRTAVRQVLTGHEPYPAVVVDRGWNLVDANASVALFTDGVAQELLAPPANVLRVSLHPDGMAPRIVNLGEWRAHLLGRLRRQVALTADPELDQLYDELCAYPCDQPEPEIELPGPGDVVVPLRIRHGDRELAFFSTMATFGTPLDITVAELVIESFFPADPDTAAVLRDSRAYGTGGDG